MKALFSKIKRGKQPKVEEPIKEESKIAQPDLSEVTTRQYESSLPKPFQAPTNPGKNLWMEDLMEYQNVMSDNSSLIKLIKKENKKEKKKKQSKKTTIETKSTVPTSSPGQSKRGRNLSPRFKEEIKKFEAEKIKQIQGKSTTLNRKEHMRGKSVDVGQDRYIRASVKISD